MLKAFLLVMAAMGPLFGQVDPLVIGVTTREQVTRILGSPNSTYPYSDYTKQWSAERPDENGVLQRGSMTLTFTADGILSKRRDDGIPIFAYSSMPDAPIKEVPWVGTTDGTSIRFVQGDKKLTVDGFSFKKPWLSKWTFTFTINNETGHVLDMLNFEASFRTKADAHLTRKVTFVISAIQGIGHPWTVTLAPWVQDDLKSAEKVDLQITGFRSRMSEAEAQDTIALAEKEKADREARAEVERIEQEKKDAVARAARDESDRLAAIETAKQDAKDKAKAKQSALAAKKKRDDVIARQPARYQEMIRKHKVCIGMDEDAVVLAWGRPRAINRTVGAWGTHEQWCYSSTYLYFENGVMTSFQD